MTPVFAARRRAEEFDSLVGGSAATGRTDARYAEFLEIVGALRELPTPEARPEFVADLRARLMTAADTLLVPADEARLRLPARRPARERRVAAAVGGLAIVGATTTMAMAAQSALPGDVLYPLKRAIENAQAGISVDDGAKGETLLANASGRLDEVTALSRDGRLEDTEAIASTLNTFTEQATEASDLLLADYASTGEESSIADLRDFTADSMQTLADLEAVVPVDARDELLHAARVLTQIDAEAAQACPTCAGAGITEIPRILTTSAGFADESGTVIAPAVKDVKETSPDQPQLPDTDGADLSPGSVLNPPSTSDTDTSDGSGGGGGTTGGDDPIGDLTDGLTGGDSSTSSDTLPELPGPLDAVTDGLDDVTDPLLP